MISGLNRFEFICRLAAPVEVRYGQTGTPFTEVEVLISKFIAGGGQKDVRVKVKIYGEQAEQLKEMCVLGSRIFVEGEISVDEWTDKQTKQPRSKMVLSGNKVMCIDRRMEAPPSSSAPWPAARPSTSTPWSKPAPAAPANQPKQPDLPAEKDDSVPF